MKKFRMTSLLIVAVTLMFTSCATITTMSTKEQAPRFTTIEKVLKLNSGMSYDEVVKTLGSDPYNMYSLTYEDKQTVYIWYYKIVERKEDPKVLSTPEGSVSGEEVIDKQQMLYVTFDENKKLVKAITDAGKGQKTAGNTGAAETTVTQEQKPIWKIW